MKLLILGKNGQVGWELQRALQPLGEVLALGREKDEQTNFSGDVTDFSAIKKCILEFSPDIVVNATAYTVVDLAESEPQQADLVNHLAVKNLAELAKQQQILLIHYSTDYVFDGSGNHAWIETDIPNPKNVYGQSKRQGEIALEQSSCQFINLRTSWVYGTHGQNFIKTMLKLAQNREKLSIVADQIGAPTSAALIADVTAHIIRSYSINKEQQLQGHYHLAAQGETSWFDYAKFVFQIAQLYGVELKIQQVDAITTKDYPTPADRPLNSRLNTQKIRTQFALHLPTWQQGVMQTVKEIIE